MRSSPPQSQDDVLEFRKKRADGGKEPLNTEERTIQERGRSLYVNPTDFGRRVLGLRKGDSVTVHVYSDGIWIEGVDEDVDE